MSNDITVIDGGPLTRVQVVAQKRLIQEVMKAVMLEGTHFGTIPGCKQPSLYKAGSEAILSTFRISVVPCVEDLSTRDCYRYRVTCQGVLPTGEVVGAGIGECSTDEEKYKWRGAVVPAEYDNTPEDRRRIKYSKPSSWNKEVVTQQVRTNPADLANTVLKMAKKRAQIDLTLTATGASDCFSQDLEDLPEELREELVGNESQQRQGKPEVKPPQARTEPKPEPTNGGKFISEAQGKMLYAKIKNSGVKAADFFAHFGIARLGELPAGKMTEALDAIGNGKIATTVKTEDAPVVLPEVCSDCGQVYVDGACRNMTCPEGKDY